MKNTVVIPNRWRRRSSTNGSNRVVILMLAGFGSPCLTFTSKSGLAARLQSPRRVRTPDDAMAGMEWLYGDQKELAPGL